MLALAALPATAAGAEDELGNWLIYNGTVRFSDHWTLFTEGQIRLYEVASNIDEVFARAAGHYDFTPKSTLGLGYMRSRSRPFDGLDPDTTENRLYLHYAIKHQLGRSGFEHRYRLEERWLDTGGASDTSTRFRYRLQVTTPVNRKTMEPGVWFVNAYDELFININSQRSFDQNRLYVAGGRQFTRLANFQFGLLWQARTSEDFLRLQLFYTHNFDLRER